MIKNKKILVVGAGGFIGGHLVKRLLNDENFIIATDIKPKEYWFQDFEKTKNYYSMDMKEIDNCRKVTKNVESNFEAKNLFNSVKDEFEAIAGIVEESGTWTEVE